MSALDIDHALADTALGHLSAKAPGQPYIWQPPGNERRVSLELDVVDRILQEALRGLGSVPRRGVEVGGVLLGSRGEDGTLAITGCVPVPCSHAQGSSFVLSPVEFQKMEATVGQFAPSLGRPSEAVGFYRSHTREGFGLSLDDVRVFDALFPGDWPVILLVKPSISRVSQGAFFFREEGGVRRVSSYLEFPFRRRELAGPAGEEAELEADGSAAPELGFEAAAAQGVDAEALDETADAQSVATVKPDGMQLRERGSLGLGGEAAGEAAGSVGAGASGASASGAKMTRRTSKPRSGEPGEADSNGRAAGPKRRWALLPLSFLFLLLGLFLGIQSSLILGPRLGGTTYSLGLRAVPVNAEARRLQISWDRGSNVISLAQDGTLHIDDGGSPKAVPLTREQLLSGIATYPPVSDHVRFRLDVRLRDNASFSESVDYARR